LAYSGLVRYLQSDLHGSGMTFCLPQSAAEQQQQQASNAGLTFNRWTASAELSCVNSLQPASLQHEWSVINVMAADCAALQHRGIYHRPHRYVRFTVHFTAGRSSSSSKRDFYQRRGYCCFPSGTDYRNVVLKSLTSRFSNSWLVLCVRWRYSLALFYSRVGWLVEQGFTSHSTHF